MKIHRFIVLIGFIFASTQVGAEDSEGLTLAEKKELLRYQNCLGKSPEDPSGCESDKPEDIVKKLSKMAVGQELSEDQLAEHAAKCKPMQKILSEDAGGNIEAFLQIGPEYIQACSRAAISCCGNPASCSSVLEEGLKQTSMWGPVAGMLGQMAGATEGGMGSVSCLAGSAGAVAGLASSSLMGQKCKLFRLGDDEQISGCSPMCSQFQKAALKYFNSNPEAQKNVTLVSKVEASIPLCKQCNTITQTTEQNAQQQVAALLQTLGQAQSCVQALTDGNGDSLVSSLDSIDTNIDCNSAQNAGHPSCQRLSFNTGAGGDNFGSTLSGLDGSEGDLLGDRKADDPLGQQPITVTDSDQSKANGAGQNGGPGGGAGRGLAANGAATGAAGANQKSGGRRRGPKARTLVGGYATGAPGGGGGGRRGAKKGGRKGFKFGKFAKKKDKKKNNDAILRNLASIAEQGVSTTPQEIIFARATERMYSGSSKHSCDPKSTYECRRVRKTWMDTQGKSREL